jgi:hypothetical protein
MFSICIILQFLNKLLYAKEGAKDIMDRTCADLPWHIRLEVDGVDIEVPEVGAKPSITYPSEVMYI